jgi:acyl-coenzyme A synthetase/AMP-(fatty) acid ligase
MHLAEILAVENSHLLRDVKLRPGGAAVPALLRRRILDEVTPHLYVRYAATECGAIAMAHPRDHDDEATCGVPLAGVDLEIVADDGAAMPVGKIGEIRLRAPGMAAGYLRDPAKTAQRFRGGWFYPGDIGYLRKDGQLVVVGRKDDMINLNGINIFPAEIERVLEQHPDVVAAAIVSLESSVHGQVPIAAVELRAGSTTTPTQILGFARERLALRAPRRIAIVENMPRNEQGKILKSGVRSLVLPDKRR